MYLPYIFELLIIRVYYGIIRVYYGIIRVYYGIIRVYYGIIRVYYGIIRVYYGIRVLKYLSVSRYLWCRRVLDYSFWTSDS